MRLRTPICDLLGIDYPIFAAGMGGVTLAPLTGVVSEAGGFGVLGATFLTPAALRQEIAAVRRITDKPFGVDVLIPNDIPPEVEHYPLPPFPSFLADLLPEVEGLPRTHPPALTLELARAQVEVSLEARVPVLVSALGTPEWLVQEARQVGTKVMSMAGSVRHARKLDELGVDVIIAQGSGRRHQLFDPEALPGHGQDLILMALPALGIVIAENAAGFAGQSRGPG